MKNDMFQDDEMLDDELTGDTPDEVAVEADSFAAGSASAGSNALAMLATQSSAKSAGEIIDEGKKLVFLLDVSASMGAGMDHGAGSVNTSHVSRIDLLKKLTIAEIAKRRAKNPGAEIMLYQFGSRVRPVKAEEGHIEGLRASDGNTLGAKAITGALEHCIKKPSKMGVHHLISVTDGEWGDIHNLPDPELMKQHGCVPDIIVIGRSDGGFDDLRQWVERCGGIMTFATTVQDFEQKFIGAASRLLCAAN